MAAERAKATLRERVREARDRLPQPERTAAATRVEEALLRLPEVASAATVAMFDAFGAEIPTSRMVSRLLDDGKRVLLPFLDEDGMEMAEIGAEEGLVPTAYGPREPASRTAVDPTEVDVIVVPAIAFDRRGHRLGYGGGHYDRYLRRLRPDAKRIGIAFEVQVVDDVPAGDADERVHLIVTETGSLDCRLVQ